MCLVTDLMHNLRMEKNVNENGPVLLDDSPLSPAGIVTESHQDSAMVSSVPVTTANCCSFFETKYQQPILSLFPKNMTQSAINETLMNADYPDSGGTGRLLDHFFYEIEMYLITARKCALLLSTEQKNPTDDQVVERSESFVFFEANRLHLRNFLEILRPNGKRCSHVIDKHRSRRSDERCFNVSDIVETPINLAFVEQDGKAIVTDFIKITGEGLKEPCSLNAVYKAICKVTGHLADDREKVCRPLEKLIYSHNVYSVVVKAIQDILEQITQRKFSSTDNADHLTPEEKENYSKKASKILDWLKDC
jgi:hypothetical protein